MRLFLALAPLFPPLSFLGVFHLRALGRLPRWGQALLWAYGLSLLLPALLAPTPLALPLALFRLVYALGLLGLGVALGSASPPREAMGSSPNAVGLEEEHRPLAPLGYGLLGVYLVALAASFLVFGDKVQEVRLSHPFHSPVGLGLLGGLGVLLALYLPYPWPLRLLLGGLGGLVLLLSGSRGGMLGLLLGASGGLLFRRRGLLALGLVGLGLYLGISLDIGPAQRFFQAGLSDREGIWLAAYEAFRMNPWGGQGPYLLGNHLLNVLFGRCFLFPLLEARGLTCPAWLEPWAGTWAFAHNHLLQALGESGVLGAFGLLLLTGGFLAGAWGQGLPFSLLLAFLGMGAVDNPFQIPSPFRGEIFFILGGMALARRPLDLPGGLARAGLMGLGVLLVWSLPFLYLASRPLPPPPSLAYAVLPERGGGVLSFREAQGYQVQIWLCQGTCRRIGWTWSGEKPMVFTLPEGLPPGRYRLRVLFLSPHRLAYRPVYAWERDFVYRP